MTATSGITTTVEGSSPAALLSAALAANCSGVNIGGAGGRTGLIGRGGGGVAAFMLEA